MYTTHTRRIPTCICSVDIPQKNVQDVHVWFSKHGGATLLHGNANSLLCNFATLLVAYSRFPEFADCPRLAECFVTVDQPKSYLIRLHLKN